MYHYLIVLEVEDDCFYGFDKTLLMHQRRLDSIKDAVKESSYSTVAYTIKNSDINLGISPMKLAKYCIKFTASIRYNGLFDWYILSDDITFNSFEVSRAKRYFSSTCDWFFNGVSITDTRELINNINREIYGILRKQLRMDKNLATEVMRFVKETDP